MAIKKRAISNADIEKLVNDLAERPYGQEQDTLARVGLLIPKSLKIKLKEMALANERQNRPLSTISELIRDCIEKTYG